MRVTTRLFFTRDDVMVDDAAKSQASEMPNVNVYQRIQSGRELERSKEQCEQSLTVTITSNRNQFGFILVEIYKNIDNSNERDNACCYLRRQFRWCWHPEYGQALLPRGMVPGNLELSTLSI